MISNMETEKPQAYQTKKDKYIRKIKFVGKNSRASEKTETEDTVNH